MIRTIWVFCALWITGSLQAQQAHQRIIDSTEFVADSLVKYVQLPAVSSIKNLLEGKAGQTELKSFERKSFRPAKNSAYYFVYSVSNQYPGKIKIGLDSWSDIADFYVLHANGTIDSCTTGVYVGWSKKNAFRFDNVCTVKLDSGETVSILYHARFTSSIFDTSFKIMIVSPDRVANGRLNFLEKRVLRDQNTMYNFYAGFFFMASLIYFFFFGVVRERLFLFFGIFVLLVGMSSSRILSLWILEYPEHRFYYALFNSFCFATFLFFYREYFETKTTVPKWDKVLIALCVLFVALNVYRAIIRDFAYPALNMALTIGITACFGIVPFYIKSKDKKYKRLLLYAALPVLIFIPLVGIVYFIYWITGQTPTRDNPFIRFFENADLIQLAALAWLVLAFSRTLLKRFTLQREQIGRHEAEKQAFLLQQETEKRQFTEGLNAALEHQVKERTAELQQTIQNLKNTQSQLVQSEKMASLGEMTAGIAHEIQNPLNFVNNFAEVNQEITTELKDEVLSYIQDPIAKENIGVLLDSLKENSEKIRTHGKRAESIVKNMLHHSRNSTGVKEDTNINALVHEYAQLAFHGIRAKDKSFQSDLDIQLDPMAGNIAVIPQEIGRVVLNLMNNSFYAVKNNPEERKPRVTLVTEKIENEVVIRIMDNGGGISEKNLKKIFQPFFTTKPTGEGTGLGLSLSYDIITKGHGGKMEVQSVEQEGTTFTITLPSGA